MRTIEYLESEIRRRHRQRREALRFSRSIHRWINFDEVGWYCDAIAELNDELRRAKRIYRKETK